MFFNKKEVKKCTLPQILSYLKNPTEVEINYFKTSVIEYLDKVKNKKILNKFILLHSHTLISLKIY